MKLEDYIITKYLQRRAKQMAKKSKKKKKC